MPNGITDEEHNYCALLCAGRLRERYPYPYSPGTLARYLRESATHKGDVQGYRLYALPSGLFLVCGQDVFGVKDLEQAHEVARIMRKKAGNE